MKIDFECNDEYLEVEQKLAYLILQDEIFCNNGWYDDSWPKDKTTLHVNCNDTFGYACADSEDINYSEIEDLYEMNIKDPVWGTTLWCIKKRNCKPIIQIVESLKNAGYKIEDYIK
jgi:hypothetical protein